MEGEREGGREKEGDGEGGREREKGERDAKPNYDVARDTFLQST
jgi:hypothetical protein